MKVGAWLKDNMESTRELVESGYEGAVSARDRKLNYEPVANALARGAQTSWKSVALGACAGSVALYLASNRKSKRGAVLGGIAGGFIGLGGAMVWKSRKVVGAMASGARQGIGRTRDAQWLARNPIDYA